MLPFLPALIMLLLQGPSNFERLAVNGRLPDAFEAMNRQIGQPGAAVLSERQEQAIASLIAAGSTAQQLSHALWSFLFQSIVSEPAPVPAEPAQAIIQGEAAPPSSSGFAKSQRSRDGPATPGAA